MKTPTLLWAVVSVLTTTTVRADDPSQAQDLNPPQVITLDDGTRLTYLGATYGTRHWPPHFEGMDGRNGNWLYTRSNTPVVWIEAEHDPARPPILELLASDAANTACVNLETRTSSHVKTGVDIQGFTLDAFPRWEKETILRVKPYGGLVSKDHFVMTNPRPGPIADWTPKPLPDTETDGDLAVTLTRLEAAAPLPYRQGGTPPPTNDPAGQCVRLTFDLRQNGQATTNWYLTPVLATSDAAGNLARGVLRGYPKNGIFPSYPDRLHPTFPFENDGYYYQPGLWPEEPAWKVRLEFIRQSGFSDDELVTFTNLSVRTGSRQDYEQEWTWDPGKTNYSFIAGGQANGVPLRFLPPLLVPDFGQPGQTDLSVIIFTDSATRPPDMNLTVLQATDDQGHELWHPFTAPWAGHFSLDFPRPGDVHALNLKLALHKSRFVEFTVKPATQ